MSILTEPLFFLINIVYTPSQKDKTISKINLNFKVDTILLLSAGFIAIFASFDVFLINKWMIETLNIFFKKKK